MHVDMCVCICVYTCIVKYEMDALRAYAKL